MMHVFPLPAFLPNPQKVTVPLLPQRWIDTDSSSTRGPLLTESCFLLLKIWHGIILWLLSVSNYPNFFLHPPYICIRDMDWIVYLFARHFFFYLKIKISKSGKLRKGRYVKQWWWASSKASVTLKIKSALIGNIYTHTLYTWFMHVFRIHIKSIFYKNILKYLKCIYYNIFYVCDNPGLKMEEASWIKAKTLVTSHLPKAEMFQRKGFQFLISGPVKY